MKVSLKKLLIAVVFISLAAFSFNSYAWCKYRYVGNPNRPYTIWIPGHYEGCCWVEGHYVKFLKIDCGCRACLTWTGCRYVYSKPVVVVGTIDTF